MAFNPFAGLLAPARTGVVRPGDIQRAPASEEEARRWLWMQPEESEFRAEEPAPPASPNPWEDPLRRAGLLDRQDELDQYLRALLFRIRGRF